MSARVVWITGASSGIGRALAEEFVSHGDSVAVSARRLADLKILQTQLNRSAGKCEVYRCDMTEAADVENVGASIVKALGTVDILINNAGVTSFKDFLSTSLKEFDEIINTNLRGLYVATTVVLPAMVERKSGTIINILSFAAKATYTGSSVYSASKAGAESMMNVLRAETRDKGIKILNVFPGPVQTEMWSPKHRERYGGRMMQPAEIAKLIYEMSCQPSAMQIEDIVIRPQGGDLKL